MSHTHGPWEWIGDHLESKSPDANYADVLTVEMLPRNAYPELQCGELVIENDADRPLIAAAPELLDALQKLVELANESDGLRFGTLSAWFVRDIAEAAIAKARGES